MPTTARVTFSPSTAGSAIAASSTAIRPEVSVIGSTPARVTTSQRVTEATTPCSGGLVVRNAYRHAARRACSVSEDDSAVTAGLYRRFRVPEPAGRIIVRPADGIRGT